VVRSGSRDAGCPLSAFPTPSIRKRTITFDAGMAGIGRVEIFDINGRRLAVLRDGPFSAGLNTLDMGWPGCERTGPSQRRLFRSAARNRRAGLPQKKCLASLSGVFQGA